LVGANSGRTAAGIQHPDLGYTPFDVSFSEAVMLWSR